VGQECGQKGLSGGMLTDRIPVLREQDANRLADIGIIIDQMHELICIHGINLNERNIFDRPR
jgi:hypothetical protein